MRPSVIAVVLSSCLLGFVSAAPAARSCKCNVAKDVIPLPSGQTTLVAPSGEKPIFIAAGFGTQNYSCSAAGTFTSTGAVAKLFDASCVYESIDSIFSGASSVEAATTEAKAVLGAQPLVLGDHYSVNDPTGAADASPAFDFRADSQKGNPEAFVITAKAAGIPAPKNSTTNIDWFNLQAIPGNGTLASHVFRVFTVGGQPPTSCTPGSAPITVPYATIYWFFK